MDRRQFLVTAGVAVSGATPAQSLDPMHRAVPSESIEDPRDATLFQRVDFTSDGLALDPREYAHLLSQVTRNQSVAADYYSIGGAVQELEQQFAQLLGKQAAIFVPTGTLANHLAIRKLAGNDRRVLVQAESHLLNDSGDCAEILSGLKLIPLAQDATTLSLVDIKQWVRRSAGGRVETKIGVISIENPVRRQDHAVVAFDALERVCGYAREQGIRLHLDGARLFNLPLHTGKSVKAYAALFDTVYVSLWKLQWRGGRDIGR
jgi:threonine aldolase